jgi:hypothetical protein
MAGNLMAGKAGPRTATVALTADRSRFTLIPEGATPPKAPRKRNARRAQLPRV